MTDYAQIAVDDKEAINGFLYDQIHQSYQVVAWDPDFASDKDKARKQAFAAMRDGRTVTQTPAATKLVEQEIETRRELIAGNPETLAGLRRLYPVLKRKYIDAGAIPHYFTQRTEALIALDGDQHTPQTNLPIQATLGSAAGR